jgi:methionyl-tRNA formyltransferase
LYLNKIGMIAANTSRTRYYLRELIKHNLKPNYVLVLLNDNEKDLPGQIGSETVSEIVDLLKEENFFFEVSPNGNINSKQIKDLLLTREESTFIYSGFGGEIIKDYILNSGKEFLHIHGGYLPDYKGSTTNYFSLIEENSMGASSIFLTKDIDCGPILKRKKFPAPKDRTKIDHIYDSKVRAKVLIETLQNYVKKGKFDFEFNTNIEGETFYIIHPVLKHLAILG